MGSSAPTGLYSNVRPHIYAAYFLHQFGYVLQNISLRSALVMVFECTCHGGRALAQARFIAPSAQYDDFQATVRRRLLRRVG